VEERVSARACALLLLLVGCAAPQGQALVEEDLPRRMVQDDERSPVSTQRLHESEHQTINLLRVDVAVPMHRHLHSEETVFVLSGRGTLHLDGGTRDLEAGDLVVVPRNTPHGFTPTDGPAVVLSIFTPAFREGDRVMEPK
jgi:quercetin dioxygenase-like cupin family protein